MNDLEDRVRDCLRAQGARAQIVDLTSAARLRSRQLRRRRRRALAIGGALPVVAGAAAALGTTVALTIGSAPPALAAVTSALNRTLTQSYRLSQRESGYYIRNGHITDRSQGTCTTKADPVRHLKAISCSNGTGGPADDVYREVGSYVYLYFTDPLGQDRHWQRTPATCQAHLSKIVTINGFTLATPQQVLSEIKKAGKVTVAGPASGPGWTGTRYAFTTVATRQLQVSGTVDVDRQGRARNLVLIMRFGPAPVQVITQDLMFSDFGARVTVTSPPADQTFPWSC